MAGMFLTPDQVKEVGKISNRCALDAVAEAYGPTFGGALYASCLRNWEAGATITASVLCLNVGRIFDAWDLRGDIAGVLLLRHDGGFIPLYLHLPTLANKLADKHEGYWVGFSEIFVELNR